MEQQPSGSPEDETQRLIEEARERVQPLYDKLTSRRNAVSPARLAIDHYTELAAQRGKPAAESDKSPDMIDVPLPEGEDKV
jgi:hypothetical protein